MIIKARRVFISHSSADKDLVNRLLAGLRKEGLRPFVDNDPKDGLQPGEEWKKRLSEAMKRTDSVLLVISQNWIESAWCQAEYRAAILLKKHIIPVVVDDTSHEEIEPQRQKLFLKSDTDEIDPAVFQSIRRVLPMKLTRVAIGCIFAAVVLCIILLGLERKTLGEWDIVEFGGGVIRDLTRDTFEPDQLYAASWSLMGSRGIFESSDGGQSWRRLDVPLLQGDPNRVFSNDNEILVASDGAALFFDRKERVWKELQLGGLSDDFLFIRPFPGKAHDLVWGTLSPGGVSAGGGSVIAAGQADPTYKSSPDPGGFGMRGIDGEISYAPFQINDVAFHPQIEGLIVGAAPDGPGLVISDDEGKTFRAVKGFSGKKPFRLLISRNGYSLFAATADGVWRARGVDWKRRSFTFEHVFAGDARGGCLAQAGERFYYGADTGLFIARDDNSRFEEFQPQPPISHVNDILPMGDDLLIATGGGGAFRLRAQQNVWKQILTSGGMAVSNGWSFPEFSLVAAGAFLYISSDSGQTYDILEAFPGNVINLVRMNASEDGARAESDYRSRSKATQASLAYDQSVFVAGIGQEGLFRKESGTGQWETCDLPVRGVVSGLAVSESKPNVAVAVLAGRCFLSDDSGDSWAELGTESSTHFFAAFSDPKNGFWISGNQDGQTVMFRCTDNGENWRALPAFAQCEAITGFTSDFTNSKLLFASIDGTILTCDRNSETVDTLSRLPITRSEWIELLISKNGRIWATCQEGKAYESADGGRSFVKLPFDRLSAEGKGVFHGVGLDTEGYPQFFTDKGMVIRTRDYVVTIGQSAYTWKADRLMRRIGLR